jgi:hypothetical protein
MTDLANQLLDAIIRASDGLDGDSLEDSLQVALAELLRPSHRELRARFAAPAFPPYRPSQAAIDALKARRPPRHLASEGRDPCASAAKLDLLWQSTSGSIPIELKFCAKWKGDTSGYQFLKDVHRLERLEAAGDYAELSMRRFAAFVTSEAVYWQGGRPEPAPFWLTDGGRLPSGYWIQYDQQSPDTLWFSYPPFFLANSYTLAWHDLRRGWRCLLVEVQPQTPTRPV